MSSYKKRPLAEEVEMNEGYVRIVDERLRKLMDGVKLCREEELTRVVLLEFLKSQGTIEEVKGLVEVTVQTMTGASFAVMLEDGSNCNVRALKAEIEEAEGASRHLQELFILVEGAEDGNEEPLSDDFEIESACTVALCMRVKPEAEWEWDAASDLIKDKVFELSGPNNSIATKIDQDRDLNNFMVVCRAMGAGTGKHTISMKLVKGRANRYMDIYCGVARDGAPCNEIIAVLYRIMNSTLGWFMDSEYGSLFGSGQYFDDYAGKIESGQVLTMQVDTDAGTLKFWVDGKAHGPGCTSGVTGPLRWAIVVANTGSSVEIVPTPELYQS